MEFLIAHDILEYIDLYQVANGYPPTYREIRDVTGYPLGTIHNYLRKLSERGFIAKERGARCVRIIRKVSVPEDIAEPKDPWRPDCEIFGPFEPHIRIAYKDKKSTD